MKMPRELSILILSIAISSVFVAEASMPNWDYLVFAQQWPPGVCQEMNVTHSHSCKIADNTTAWTVHGAWPTKNGTMGPNYCNATQKFDPEKISPLLGELIQNWPNLYSDTPQDDFWKHEWEKHGTCAESLPSLSGEYNFFSQVLKLNKKYSLLQILADHGITPKPNYVYQFSDVLNALTTSLGRGVTVSCFAQKSKRIQYIEQVEMCINKNMKMINCPGPGGIHCSDTMPVAYMYTPKHL